MGVDWAIGCFNRPWGKWSYDAALDGIKAAGYRLTGLLGEHKGEPFVSPDATPAYLDALKERIRMRGLAVNLAWLRTRHNIALEDAIQEARKQIENAKRLGVRYLLSLGVERAEEYDHFYHVMSDASAYAKRYGIQVVVKPHGGCSASADEIISCISKVNHSNFRVWHDAGNIIYYTGKDPVADVQRIAHLVSGFSAKDCARLGGDVMIQFGEGRVGFRDVFSRLKAAGFKGPVMVECCAGQTWEEVTAKARENREFLERLFGSL